MLHLTKPVRVLRSQCAPTLERPRTRNVKKNGDRAFSADAPALWNGLPGQIRCAKTLDSYSKRISSDKPLTSLKIVQCSAFDQDVILDLALYKFGIFI